MNDIENLLRETLTDPRRRVDTNPALYDNVRRAARRRRQGMLSAAGATAAVIAIVVASIAVNRGPAHRSVAPTATATPTATPTASTPTDTPDPEPTHESTSTQLDLGQADFGANDIIVTPTAEFVMSGLAPMRLLQLDPATGKVVRSVYGMSDTNGGLLLDANGTDLFLWSAAGELREYNTKTLELTNLVYDALPVGVQIFNAVSLDGQPWFTTDQGVYSVTVARNSALATKVPGLSNVYGLTADPGRHRVLVGAFAGGGGLGTTQIVAVDGTTHALTRGGGLPFGKESIVVVGNDVWTGGYGDSPAARFVQLDAQTLRPTTTPDLNSVLGPGAIIWPGQHVLWVRHGGDERLDCVDPASGKVLQTWPEIQGPVSSVAGAAYAVHNGLLLRLTLESGCSG
ncbi:MAG TPA: hypothetical protein VIL94_01825 [Acidothermaceae bacterium]|jgi:hypothetical protein